MNYLANDGKWYVLNLIDTPGHVDFSYEVSRSLAACEGALLVVDASQGVEAQTIANVFLALDNDLEIVPVLNKIDLPGADTDNVAAEVESTIGLDCTDAIPASAKIGLGVPEILEAIVQRIPPPQPNAEAKLRALIFDSYYDPYRGVVTFIRVVDGELRKGDKVRFVASGKEYEVLEVGTLAPGREQPTDVLRAGEVGYLHGGIKSVTDARVGDTIVNAREDAKLEALSGYQEPVPVVYCGLFPTDTTQYQLLRDSLEKLQLNDAALSFEPETSSAMGFGFRCGFLGLLHMEIIQERLEREYDLDLITTAPSVVYRVKTNRGETVEVDNPAQLPGPDQRESIAEPYVKLDVFVPKEFVGPIMALAEVVTDFFDQLKSCSRGYASMEYDVLGYRRNKLVKLDVKLNGEEVDPLAVIVHQDDAYRIGRALCVKLKEFIPRQQFRVPIQACIGAKVIAAQQIQALRKDVLAKCYVGDISRKKKLLQKQAKGKKRMKAMGKVEVPQEAFMAVLKLDRNEM